MKQGPAAVTGFASLQVGPAFGRALQGGKKRGKGVLEGRRVLFVRAGTLLIGFNT